MWDEKINVHMMVHMNIEWFTNWAAYVIRTRTMTFMELNMSVVRVEFDSFQKFDCPDLGCCLGSGSLLNV